MQEERVFAGIDVGTTTTKAVVINGKKQVLGTFVRRSGTDLALAATLALEQALGQASAPRDHVQAIVATGYGRKSVPFATDSKTEIACHGYGCFFYYPEPITVVDIGGQDSKVIKLDREGRCIGFKMNRKCAAGTGAFMEEIARKLDIPAGELNRLAKEASVAAQIGSYCTVFTATEVLDRIRAGEKTGEIVRGLFDSVTKRITEMDTLVGRVIISGGLVAYNDILAELLSARARVRTEIAPHPQEMGAFGAALYAAELPAAAVLSNSNRSIV